MTIVTNAESAFVAAVFLICMTVVFCCLIDKGFNISDKKKT